MPIIALNKRARYDYEIQETLEAGLVLSGQETKSIRGGHITLAGSYATFKNDELWLLNAHIPAYKMAGKLTDYDPERSRKLLLHKKEIKYLIGKLREKGLTLIPLKVYTTHRRIKVELGMGRGKKMFDKRETIKKREVDRKIRQEMTA